MNIIVVDCVNGNDEDLEAKKYKTIERALEELKQKDKLLITPGTYPGLNFECDKFCFEFEIEGNGISSELCFFTLKTETNLKIKNLRLNEINMSLSASFVSFIDIDFCGNNTLTFDQFDQSTNNEIEFINCVFGLNYQIILKKRNYSLSFKNCSFRGKRSIPIIYSKKGDYNINATMCNIKDTPFIFNVASTIYIYHSNCLIEKMWEGKECSCFSSTEEIVIKEKLIFSSSESETDSQSEEKIRSIKVRTIDTDKYSHIGLDKRTEFLRLKGVNSIIIELPDIKFVKLGHVLEIVNECPAFTINDKTYYNSYCKARLLEDGWFVYKAC